MTTVRDRRKRERLEAEVLWLRKALPNRGGWAWSGVTLRLEAQQELNDEADGDAVVTVEGLTARHVALGCACVLVAMVTQKHGKLKREVFVLLDQADRGWAIRVGLPDIDHAVRRLREARAWKTGRGAKGVSR